MGAPRPPTKNCYSSFYGGTCLLCHCGAAHLESYGLNLFCFACTTGSRSTAHTCGSPRILAVYLPLGFLQEAVHLHQIGCGSAIRPEEEGDRRGTGIVVEPPLHRPLVGGPSLIQLG